MAAQAPDQVTGVRPNGLEDTPMFRVNVNAAKAEAMGVSLSDINQTISTAFGSSYVNDFLNQGRVKKVYVQAGTPFRMLPDNINQWYVRNASGTMAPLSAYSSTEWTYGSPRLERYNGLPSMEILGKPLPGKVPVKRWILWPRWSQNYPLAWVILDRTFLSGKIIHQPGPDAVCHLANRGVPRRWLPYMKVGQFRSQ